MEQLRSLFVIFLVALFVQPALATDPTLAVSYDAMVVMHIQDLDDAALTALAKSVGSEKNVTIEYTCVWSGVVVLKFSNASVSERADVITLARRQLTMAKIDKEVEFLHVHAEERGPGKC